MNALCALVCALSVSVRLATSQMYVESDQQRYTRELLETLKKQVEWSKMATEQLSTMMGPRLGTHFTELAGYCAHGVSVTSHWNITATDCLYECLSADECAGYNFYTVRSRPGATRCEMVTVNLFCGIHIDRECTMYIRRWRNNQFGTLFSGSRIASAVSRTEITTTMSECVGLCKKDGRCMHVSYRQPDQTCTMHATGGGATIEDFAWIAYGRVVRCPDFYIRFQGSCLRASKGSNESWSTAQSMCRAEGAHMVSIHSVEENQMVREIILREAPNLNWWIGAHEKDGEWRWTDTIEAEAELSFTYWSENASYNETARCAYFDVASMKWDRTVCDGTSEADKFYYICETSASHLTHPFNIGP